MKFIIFNGSPKCEQSVTLQSMRYLENQNQEHEFEVIHINKRIKSCLNDKIAMEEICNKVRKADGVIWSFPIYTAHVPSNLKLFIELIYKYDLGGGFKDKYTTVFSTSVHYFDHTAQNYMHGICDDLDMNYMNYLSHDMEDLLKPEMRDELKKFFKLFVTCIAEGITFPKEHKPLEKSDFIYKPKFGGRTTTTRKRTFIITDAKEEDMNLKQMIDKYVDSVKGSVEVHNLNNLEIKGSCRGCLRCGYDNKCVYKDDFKPFYDNIIKEADIIVYAFTMQDRFLSSMYSLYMNRSFVYNHVPVLEGKQIGYIISGQLKDEKNTRQVLDEAGSLFGIISDDIGISEKLDEEIESFAKLGVMYSESNYIKKENFLGISGKKQLTEEIGGNLSGVFLADYKYFKANNYFPKKGLKSMLGKIQGFGFRVLMGNEKFRVEVQKNMVEHMVGAHVKLVESGEM